VLFWDTVFEKINWVKGAKWIIQRTFEYGNEQEIREITRFYGKEKETEILNSIDEKWKEKDIIDNRQQFAG
jgi:hypothetical protein